MSQEGIPVEVTTTIIDVSSRLVKNGTMTVWDVQTQDGTKWTTFKAEMGNAAIALKGQQADVRAEIKKNGDFTNYTLLAIRPGKGSVSTPAGEAVVQAAQAQASGPTVSYDQYKSLEEGKEQRKNESIHRQVATKVAAQLSEGIADFWANVDALVAFYATGTHPFQSNVSNVPVAVTASAANTTSGGGTFHVEPTPAPPPFFDPGVSEPWVGEPPPPDDDIPF